MKFLSILWLYKNRLNVDKLVDPSPGQVNLQSQARKSIGLGIIVQWEMCWVSNHTSLIYFNLQEKEVTFTLLQISVPLVSGMSLSHPLVNIMPSIPGKLTTSITEVFKWEKRPAKNMPVPCALWIVRQKQYPSYLCQLFLLKGYMVWKR